MKGNEEACFAIVMREEGGAEISRIGSDPGNWSSGKRGVGRLLSTQWGVSAPVALANGLTPGAITRDQACSVVFLPGYWRKLDCDADPKGVDLVKADMGYNGGVAAAAKLEARTRQTARTPDAFISTFSANRLALFRTFATWRTFGPRNWGPRIARVEADAHRMAGTPAAALRQHAAQAQASNARSIRTAFSAPAVAAGGSAAGAQPALDGLPPGVAIAFLAGIAVIAAAVAGVAVLRARGHALRAEMLQSLATEVDHG